MLRNDIEAAAEILTRLGTTEDLEMVRLGLAIVTDSLRDMAERAGALEGSTVPPHWRKQWWNGEGPNIVPMRRTK